MSRKLLVNGVDLTVPLVEAANAYEAKRKDQFGEAIPKMSKILVGTQGSPSGSGQGSSGNPPKHKPVKVYEGSPAAQFAAGFFFGIKAGGFKQEDLDKCLDKELKAVKAFNMGFSEIKEALKEDSDPDRHRWGQQVAVRALREMGLFIYEMATETSHRNLICPQLTDVPANRAAQSH